MATFESGSRSHTAASYEAFSQPSVRGYLYNPPEATIHLEYPYERPAETRPLKPSLILSGNGLPDGECDLSYSIQGAGGALHSDRIRIDARDGWFEKAVELNEQLAEAESLSWEFLAEGGSQIAGCTLFTWSRFQGRVKYLDGVWRPTYIDLIPVDFHAPGRVMVPVRDDGRFDAAVPARIYAVMNVNGTGYAYETMERWAWDYNLLEDREDTFTIGRTELYGMHAFDVKSPSPTVFVTFRPTALSRVLRFDADQDGRVEGEERKAMEAAMRDSPTVIGPELRVEDVKVWLNGAEQQIVQFDRIPEYNGSIWQVQYLVQIYPTPRPRRGVWHEVRIEVRSKEALRGKDIVDFGQGSVGFYRA